MTVPAHPLATAGAPSTLPPFPEALDLLAKWAPDENIRHKILVDNPARLYDF